MSKMHYFRNKFSKIVKRWGLSAPAPRDLRFFGDRKLHDLTKLCISIWLWRKRTLNKSVMSHFNDVIVITSTKNVTKLTSQDFSFLGPSQSKFLATPVRSTVRILLNIFQW